jgi:hypothetical protein
MLLIKRQLGEGEKQRVLDGQYRPLSFQRLRLNFRLPTPF